jgi:predicted transcriptional regulator
MSQPKVPTRARVEGNAQEFGLRVAGVRELGDQLALAFSQLERARAALAAEGVRAEVTLQPWVMAALQAWRQQAPSHELVGGDTTVVAAPERGGPVFCSCEASGDARWYAHRQGCPVREQHAIIQHELS